MPAPRGGGRVAVFPASFDPPTNGHMEVVRKAARLFDELVVAVYATPNKQTIFDAQERLVLVTQAVEELRLPNVRVRAYANRLTVDLAREEGAVALVRGLRGVGDFDYEVQMAHMNEQLASDVVTVAVLASSEYTFLSSTLVRDVAALGRDVSRWVPAAVAARLRERFATPLSGPGVSPDSAVVAPGAEGGADRIGGFVVRDERVR